MSKCVCILSAEKIEPSTERVCDWLNYLNVPWVRINSQALTGSGKVTVEITNSEKTINVESGTQLLPKLPEIGVVWFRRWKEAESYYSSPIFNTTDEAESYFNHSIYVSHLDLELREISMLLYSYLSSAEWLSQPRTVQVKKLDVLERAARLSLDIPQTMITNDSRDMEIFLSRHPRAVTKPISNGMMYQHDGNHYCSFTTQVTINDLPVLANCSVPILLQERLSKKYEIRSFFLDGHFYSMTMFTQTHEETKIDSRRRGADSNNLCRNVPYQLDELTEGKLRALANDLELDTGSIDLVRTIDGRLVFLEVNPVGQFEMVSMSCNYHLEREIAMALRKRLATSMGQSSTNGESC